MQDGQAVEDLGVGLSELDLLSMITNLWVVFFESHELELMEFSPKFGAYSSGA